MTYIHCSVNIIIIIIIIKAGDTWSTKKR